MESLGQMPFGANAPTGFPDRGEDWMGGQTMLERVDFCADAAKHESSNLAPADMARDLMGPNFSAATLQAINRAPSRSDAIGLILASREFQRR